MGIIGNKALEALMWKHLNDCSLNEYVSAPGSLPPTTIRHSNFTNAQIKGKVTVMDIPIS